mmetsp:Transcript_19778/g.53309  ORF Transcript_19778/g.53309 Transcript_19778/m.53309 type:complete len:257 (+) Transcript_19778:556-1326(+)
MRCLTEQTQSCWPSPLPTNTVHSRFLGAKCSAAATLNTARVPGSVGVRAPSARTTHGSLRPLLPWSRTHAAAPGLLARLAEHAHAIPVHHLDREGGHAYQEALPDGRDAVLHHLEGLGLCHVRLPLAVEDRRDEHGGVAVRHLVHLMQRRQIVQKEERWTRVLVKAPEKEVEHHHAPAAQPVGHLPPQVVGSRMRGQWEAVAELVERHVLLDELPKLDHVRMVAAHGEELVIVHLEDLIVVVAADEDGVRAVAVRH